MKTDEKITFVTIKKATGWSVRGLLENQWQIPVLFRQQAHSEDVVQTTDRGGMDKVFDISLGLLHEVRLLSLEFNDLVRVEVYHAAMKAVKEFE
jgi:hypothetical protein